MADSTVTALAGDTITHLTQAQAVSIDEELMGPLGFSVDQLMELAGLSVAAALAEQYPPTSHRRVLVLAGPGNNGGDGLVAGRHLTHFGYDVSVCYPKPTPRPLYEGLVTQCRALGIPLLSLEQLQATASGSSADNGSTIGLRGVADVVVDALFGFSFRGAPRPPFDALLQLMAPSSSPPPIVSVDIPSGWDVESGPSPSDANALAPDMLVSLTAPKLAAAHFKGAHHYLGGRFVPPAIRQRYALTLPPFPGTAQCVRIGPAAAAPSSTTATPADGGAVPADMRLSYEVGELQESDLAADPMKQFEAWFQQAVAAQVSAEPNAMVVASVSAEGQPSARHVLLKGYDDRGFAFFTNYSSRKGRELDGSGRAALAFWWEGLQRAVRVEGLVERLPGQESDAYYASRPRGSRIGAWVSEQSSVLQTGRTELEERQLQLEGQYADPDVEVPRPPHWGGYLVQPLAVEFWQGRPSRLHDRLRYVRESLDSNDWRVERLAP